MKSYSECNCCGGHSGGHRSDCELNALQQQLADVRQERDRYRDALEYTQAYQWPLSPGVKIVLAAALTPGAKGETDGE